MMSDHFLMPNQEQNISVLPTRGQILSLEEETRKLPDGVRKDPDDFPTFHHFSDGVYVREFHMKAGEMVIGKIHRHNHMAMLIKGRAKVVSEFGNDIFEAPHIWESKATIKRAVLALEDCIFVTIHPTDETDLEKIEDEVIAPSYEALEGSV